MDIVILQSVLIFVISAETLFERPLKYVTMGLKETEKVALQTVFRSFRPGSALEAPLQHQTPAPQRTWMDSSLGVKFVMTTTQLTQTDVQIRAPSMLATPVQALLQSA